MSAGMGINCENALARKVLLIQLGPTFASVSVMGAHYPQKILWNFSVLIYIVARCVWGMSYYHIFSNCSHYPKSGCWFRTCVRCCFVQNAGELLGLFVVISVTIDEHLGSEFVDTNSFELFLHRKVFSHACHWLRGFPAVCLLLHGLNHLHVLAIGLCEQDCYCKSKHINVSS